MNTLYRLRYCIPVALMLCHFTLHHRLDAADSLSLSSDQRAKFDAQVKAIVTRHCVECHGPETQNSGVRFDAFDLNAVEAVDIEILELAREALSHHEMPPEEAEQPLTESDREILLDWIDDALTDIAIQQRSLESQPRLRRLSKREYNHTLQDLFASPSDFHTLLPPDPISEAGYDTAHSLLMISQVDLKIYMETARIALEKFLHLEVGSGQKECFFIELEDVYHHCRGALVNSQCGLSDMDVIENHGHPTTVCLRW